MTWSADTRWRARALTLITLLLWSVVCAAAAYAEGGTRAAAVAPAAPLALLLLGSSPPIDSLRRTLAARWHVALDLVVVEADSTALADASPRGELQVTGVLSDGRVLFAGSPVFRVRAGVYASVPVARRPLARGDVIDSTMIRLEPRIHWGGPAPERPLPLGWECARNLAQGDALLAPAVRTRPLVRTGDDVRAYWRRGAIRLELDAHAAGTGAIGDTIPLRTRTGERLRGVITAPQRVELISSKVAG